MNWKRSHFLTKKREIYGVRCTIHTYTKIMIDVIKNHILPFTCHVDNESPMFCTPKINISGKNTLGQYTPTCQLSNIAIIYFDLNTFNHSFCLSTMLFVFSLSKSMNILKGCLLQFTSAHIKHRNLVCEQSLSFDLFTNLYMD